MDITLDVYNRINNSPLGHIPEKWTGAIFVPYIKDRKVVIVYNNFDNTIDFLDPDTMICLYSMDLPKNQNPVLYASKNILATFKFFNEIRNNDKKQ